VSADRAQKNFDATPARKQRAKREGNVPRSSEVASIAALIGALGACAVAVPLGASRAADALRVRAAHPPGVGGAFDLVGIVGLGLLPVAAAAVAASGAGVVQAGGVRLIAPTWNWKRLAPGAGLRRMVGGDAVVGALRAVAAFVLVALALVPVVTDLFTRSAGLSDPGALAELAWGGAARACWSAVAVGAGFAVLDFALARRRWLRELKMTREEVRRDQKENDGDPTTRSRRKALYRTFARSAIARTKEASFVVVNPTHIAIAVRYAPPDVAVPQILVRAADASAQAVKLLARRHAIPIVEDVSLARALYAQGEAGRAIPSQTYVAVARVIAALIREGVLS
jgi:flagellar biosynthesis protein FlhB